MQGWKNHLRALKWVMAINWDAYPGTEKLGWKSSQSVITQTRNDRPSPISWRWASQTGSSKLFNFLSGFANLHSSFCFGPFRAWKIPAAQRLVGAAAGLGGVLNSCYHNCLCPSLQPDPGAKLEIGQVTISIPLRVACPHLSTWAKPENLSWPIFLCVLISRIAARGWRPSGVT